MHTEEQALAWSNVTGALHAKGTTVVAQLWHTGRMSHSSFHNGAPIVSASSIPIATGARVPECGVQAADGTWHPHELPRELTPLRDPASLRNRSTLSHASRPAPSPSVWLRPPAYG